MAKGIPRRREHALSGQQLDQTDSSDRGERANSLLEKYAYLKLLRIAVLIKRFVTIVQAE